MRSLNAVGDKWQAAAAERKFPSRAASVKQRSETKSTNGCTDKHYHVAR